MKTILSIPSGYRVKRLLKVIEKWRKVCDFEIHVITWDGAVSDALRKKRFNDYSKVFCLDVGQPMRSFAANQNEMAEFIGNWDIFICGADDLYPCNNISMIEPVCRENPDKVIWVKDGLFNQQPTHPIITRGWYDKHGYIFDEDYKHNFTDTDLFVRLLNAGEVVKCFDIGFDHRHPIKGGSNDSIYALGQKSYTEDELRFKCKNPQPDWEKIKEVPEVKL